MQMFSSVAFSFDFDNMKRTLTYLPGQNYCCVPDLSLASLEKKYCLRLARGLVCNLVLRAFHFPISS